MASFQFQVFVFLLLFFFLPHKASTAIICETSSCDGSQKLPVKFPFRLQGLQDRSCGYPGFNLSCNNKNQTILTFPNSGDFVVRQIDYSEQSIYISDPDHCFPGRFMQNFTASVSPFQIDLQENMTFFNCSSGVQNMNGYGYVPIGCLSSYDNLVFVTDTYYAEVSPPPATCRNIASAALTDLFLMLRYGLVQLTWVTPGCGGCVARGGNCALKNLTTLDVGCFNVPTNGGLPRSAKYGIVIGVGIPGLLCIIGLSCYLCGRIRVYRRRRQYPNTQLTRIISPQRSIFAVGLDGPTIQSYPKTLLGESGRLPKPTDNICPICLSEYQPKEELRTIPECNHYFHADCIDEWLKLNGTCPLCRNSPDGSALVTPSPSSSLSSTSLSLSSV